MPQPHIFEFNYEDSSNSKWINRGKERFCLIWGFRIKKTIARWYADGLAQAKRGNLVMYKRMSNWRAGSNHLSLTALQGVISPLSRKLHLSENCACSVNLKTELSAMPRAWEGPPTQYKTVHYWPSLSIRDQRMRTHPSGSPYKEEGEEDGTEKQRINRNWWILISKKKMAFWL